MSQSYNSAVGKKDHLAIEIGTIGEYILCLQTEFPGKTGAGLKLRPAKFTSARFRALTREIRRGTREASG